MDFTFRIGGSEGPEVTVSRSVLTGATHVRVSGQEVPRDGRGGPFRVPLADGRTAALDVRGRGYDYVPRVTVEGRQIALARDLAAWEYAVSAVPLLLLFVGGAVGGLAGASAAYFNLWVMRSRFPAPARVGIALAVAVVALGIYLLLAIAIRSAGAAS